MRKILLILSVVALWAFAGASRSPGRGRNDRGGVRCGKNHHSCSKQPWSEKCMSTMNLDLILMVERMDQARFNVARRFALNIIEKVVFTQHTNKTIKLAAFTFGSKDFTVFWPIPKKDISAKNAINFLRRIRVQRDKPLTRRAMRFTSKYPEPSKDKDGTRAKRLVLFIGSGRSGKGDEDLNVALKDVRSSISKLIYIQVGKGADRRFLRELKGDKRIMIRRLNRRTDQVLWRQMLSLR